MPTLVGVLPDSLVSHLSLVRRHGSTKAHSTRAGLGARHGIHISTRSHRQTGTEDVQGVRTTKNTTLMQNGRVQVQVQVQVLRQANMHPIIATV